MATTAASLSVPAPVDDSMEMSSPGHHNFDEDIDFDDYQPATHVNDDDRMTDDGEQIRPGTATDDVMVDDMQEGEQTVVQEEVMQDSPSHEQQLEDEDLIDYSDDELEDEVVEDAGPSDMAEQPSVAAPAIELPDGGVDEEITGDAALEQPTEDAPAATIVPETDLAPLPVGEEITVPQDGADTHDFFAEGDDQIEPATAEPSGEDIERQEDEHVELSFEEQLATDDAQTSKPVISLDTSAQPTTDGPATPTDTGLHAMTVRFGDLQFPLFKSRNQTDGLLKNDNLASLSLGELIQNCRQRLETKTGETLSEDQDLVLVFDQLGLTLVEDSRAAFECSLDEVLDVYLQLHRNDENEDIPPFSLNLSLQLKFTSSISVLKQAAAGGEGMSSFGLRHSGDEQVGEYDEYTQGQHGGEEGQEEYHEDYQQIEAAEGHEQEEAAHVQGSNLEQQQADTNDDYGEHQEQQADHPGQEEYYQENEEYQEDPDEDRYYEEDQDEATQLLDEHALEGERQVEESAGVGYNAPNDQTAAVDEAAQVYADGNAEEEKAASAATSATFEGEDGRDTTGEYTEEDLIDWDDDSDLTSDPSDQAAASHTEASTLLEDEAAEEQLTASYSASQQQADLEQDTTHTGEGADGQHAAESAHPEIDTQNFGSEDFLGDFDEQQDHEGQTEHEETYNATANADYGAYGQEDDDADAYPEQQEDFNHPDYQPGDEDEAFQTAHELFDGADIEHGPEQDASNNHADETTLVASTTNGEHHGDTEDFIDFDFDEEIAAEEKAKKPDVAAAGSHTPLAKRSFEDLTGDDEIDFESPEPKKARAS